MSFAFNKFCQLKIGESKKVIDKIIYNKMIFKRNLQENESACEYIVRS